MLATEKETALAAHRVEPIRCFAVLGEARGRGACLCGASLSSTFLHAKWFQHRNVLRALCEQTAHEGRVDILEHNLAE